MNILVIYAAVVSRSENIFEIVIDLNLLGYV